MTCPRKQKIASSFGTKAESYNQNALLQKNTAETLASHLPEIENPRILEIGCGTGFLTEELVKRYLDAELLVTDIAPEMVEVCRQKFGHLPNLSFAIMDGEHINSGTYNLIISNMAIQWFENPLQSLERMKGFLTSEGQIFYTTPGPGSFKEWHDTLDSLGLPKGTLEMPMLPGIFQREAQIIDYGDTLTFLRHLKSMGASHPRPGYVALHPGALKQACAFCDEHYEGQITWEVIYSSISG